LQPIKLYFFAKATQIVSEFLRFANFRKVGKLVASIKCSKARSVLASGGALL